MPKIKAYAVFAIGIPVAMLTVLAMLAYGSFTDSERVLPPQGPGPDTQTMLITAATRPIDSISIIDYVVQGAGITDVVEISSATPAVDLFISTLTIDSSQFATVLIEDSLVYHITRTDNVFEGMSLLETAGAAAPVIFPTRGALLEPDVRSNGTIDRIIVTTTGATDGHIGNLTLSGVTGRGRLWIHDVVIGDLIITNTEVGNLTGIDSASFVMDTTVIRGTGITESGNIEQPRDFR
jgi:hypothetical protein